MMVWLLTGMLMLPVACCWFVYVLACCLFWFDFALFYLHVGVLVWVCCLFGFVNLVWCCFFWGS